MSEMFTATAPIKLVIWDLDDTFWNGTLSEEGIALVPEHLDIVRKLVDRGIMSSIVSKNDMDPVKRVLIDAGIWDFFIFPRVAWQPKGNLIADIVEQANLRPDNVLFIDDNSINVEEARFRFPTMMVAYPQDVVPHLLSLPQAAGKNDLSRSRLKQYKQLEQKVVDQDQSSLSNVDFLRQCDIRLRLEFDIDSHLERVIELINRSNQLNYTKVRLETDAARQDFREKLLRHDIIAAAIFAADRYGSHGLIGFYMQRKNEAENRLLHYVWSCRMMNAGLEQYVYQRLGSPDIEVVDPVSNPIVVFDAVDWITEVETDEAPESQDAPRLLMIGSCDLAAVASYCSTKREEYVNGIKNGVMTRYDDFGFILGDRSVIQRSSSLSATPAWGKDEFVDFHRGLGESDVLILSLSAAMKGVHFVAEDGVVLRVHPEGLGDHIDYDPKAEFLRGGSFYANTIEQKLELLRASLALINASSKDGSLKFLLGANTRNAAATPLSNEDRALLTRYNEVCRDFCAKAAGWHYVSINEVVAQEMLLDDRHYTRIGYLAIANYINRKIKENVNIGRSEEAATSRELLSIDLAALVRAGRKVGRLSTFGSGRKPGFISSVKQAIKLTPLSNLFRKMDSHREAA